MVWWQRLVSVAKGLFWLVLIAVILQQVYFTAVQSTALTVLVAVAMGALLMHQASVILPRFGLPDFAEWLTVLILFREIAPLTVALIIIALNVKMLWDLAVGG